ncbi:retrovirus-related pol polyprotein from transposon TNT 1-94 [Tanacetum coccineum]|uniref:Retrovirus-related pol polyprotein from transposon TNT 1-94 n=1 Tax=Tanacetum coccineum TaxID=301880 RepID=A0ABQ5AG76_9ASTR
MREMIVNRNAKFAAFENEIHTLKLRLSKNMEENKTLTTTMDVWKKETKYKEDKYIEEIVDLKKQKKDLDNIVYKVGQSVQTMHMLTKPQVFYDENHKTALGYQKPFYLRKAQRIQPVLYDGTVLAKKHDVNSVIDSEETLILTEDGADLLTGSRDTNLYTLSLDDMLKSSPICLLSKASKTESWLWHRRKSKKHTHKPKSKNFIQEKLYLLHMDLCGLIRIESIDGKKYILVIVDDFSRFTWVKNLRSKNETPEFIIKFLKKVQVSLNATVRNICTDNGTEFGNQTLKTYYEDVRISHQTSVVRTPQQNDIVERRNQTLVEVARTMLIFSKAPKPDLKYFHVFGALCYPTNDRDDLGKLKPKADIEVFIGYSPTKKAYRIYNRRTRLIMETIHVDFDELTEMTFEQFGSGPELQLMTPRTISSGLVQNPSSSTPYASPTKKDWDILFQPMFDEYFQPSPSVVSRVLPVVALIPADTTGVKEQLQPAQFDNDLFQDILTSEPSSQESSSNVHPSNPPFEHLSK